MGLRTWFKETFHPNRCAREREEEAKRQQEALAQQAAEQREAAEKRKNEILDSITTDCNKARDAINSWCKEEIAKANEPYNKALEHYTKSRNDLNQTFQEYSMKIEHGFKSQETKLKSNQKDDVELIEKCRKHVINLAAQSAYYYGENKVVLDKLWEQVKSGMLHNRCFEAYSQLKCLSATNDQKLKPYSLLAGYFKQLAKHNIIEEGKFKQYSTFCHALYSSKELKHNNSYNLMDKEITRLLQDMQQRYGYMVSEAYNKDFKNFRNKYNNVKHFDNALLGKFNKAIDEINSKYEKALQELKNQRDQKQDSLNKNCQDLTQEIEKNENAYKEKYNSYIEELNSKKNTKLAEITSHENQQKAKVNEQHESAINTINQQLQEQLTKISKALDKQLKDLRHSRKARFINAFTAVAAGAAAYFSGGLLAGVSANIINSIQSSLATTGLGSLKSLIDGKDTVGFNISIDLPYPGFGSTDYDRIRRESIFSKNSFNEAYENLEDLNSKFEELNEEVKSWQSEVEDNLFYSLNHNAFTPKAGFSDILSVYSNKKSDTPLFFKASVGPLQQDGFRTVNWDMIFGNKTKRNGFDLMKDRDLQSVFCKFSDISKDSLPNAWDEPQEFIFSTDKGSFKNATKSIEDNEFSKDDLNFDHYKSSEDFKYSFDNSNYEFKNNNSEFMFDFTSKNNLANTSTSNRGIFDNLSDKYEFSTNNDEFKFNFNNHGSFTEKVFDFFIPPVYSSQSTVDADYPTLKKGILSEDFDMQNNYSYDNLDLGVKFATGFTKGGIKGSIFTKTFNFLSKVKGLGHFVKGAGVVGAGYLYSEAASAGINFETDYFAYTDEYMDIMNNPLITDSQKAKIQREAFSKLEAANFKAQNQTPLFERFKQNPEKVGEYIGLGVGASLSNKIVNGSKDQFFKLFDIKTQKSNKFPQSNNKSWQTFINDLELSANSPFAPGSVGAAKVWTKTARIKAVKLPTDGKIRFIPRKGYHPTMPLEKSQRGGYLDRFGNEWVPGPSRTNGQDFEWDVQLSNRGKMKLGWASKDGKHINVSLDGKLTHR